MLSLQLCRCRVRPRSEVILPHATTAIPLGRKPPAPPSPFFRHHAQTRQSHSADSRKVSASSLKRQLSSQTEFNQPRIESNAAHRDGLIDREIEEPEDGTGGEAWELRQLQDEHAFTWHNSFSKGELQTHAFQDETNSPSSTVHDHNDGRKQQQQQQQQQLHLRTQTPSGTLTDALRDTGHYLCLPVERHGKQDLSYRPPSAQYPPSKKSWTYVPSALASLQAILAQYIRATSAGSRVEHTAREGHDGGGERQNETSGLSDDILQVFSQRNLGYLNKRHFNVEDVVSWAWVITAPTADLAATRLLILSNSTSDPSEHRRNKAPVFLLMYLLRRADITRSAFRLLLIQSFNVLENVRHRNWTFDFTKEHHIDRVKAPWLSQLVGTGNHQELDTETRSRLYIRLLRHARLQWPEAVPSIVMDICRFRENGSNTVERQDPATLARLTFLYNRMLSIAAMPAPKAPFSTVYLNQRAQFALLKHMNEFEPPLLINREGYRAVVRVQLRHRKTRREREWALLKSKAWPPWKEDKYGLDADIGVEYGISGAKQALHRAQEAGYLPQTWEQTASILSGWDTDESPTIQTRAIHPGAGRKSSSVSIFRKVYDRPPRIEAFKTRSKESNKSSNLARSIARIAVIKADEAMDDNMLWAVRIQATRTLDEAWYCFLAYRDNRDSWHPTVCFAMFQKLVFARLSRARRNMRTEEESVSAQERARQREYEQYQQQQQQQQHYQNDHEPTPGDTREVWPTSENPRERPYLAEDIPQNEHAFMRDVLNRGIYLGGRFLAFALAYAENLGVGWQYVQHSNLSEKAIGMLVAQERIDARVLRTEVRLDVFAAFIRLLCRASRGMKSGKWRPLLPQFQHLSYGHGVTHHNPLLQAHRLLHASRSSYRPPWYDLLSALAARGALVPRFGSASPHLEASMHDVAAWDAIADALTDMRDSGVDLDFEGFHIVCVGLEKAIMAANHIRARHEADTDATPATSVSPSASPSPSLSDASSASADLAHISLFSPTKQGDALSERTERERQYMDRVLQSGSVELKRLFARIAPGRAAAGWIPEDIDAAFATATFRYVGGGPEAEKKRRREMAETRQSIGAASLLPRLLDVPKAADLHAFIRVLGLSGDRQGVVDLLRWMAWFAPEIEAKSNETRNGQRMMRRALVCARVMLERWWEMSIIAPVEEAEQDQSVSPTEQDSADETADVLLREASEIFETVEEWGEWPSDEECEHYVSMGRFV